MAGRLRQHADIWRANTSDPFVLRVLENGLELPFEEGVYPLEHHATRNFIKDDDDLTWARGAVQELVTHGAVVRWADLVPELEAAGIAAGARPHLIMELIVADKGASTPENRKRRLIHDCRYLNEHLQHWGFKLETLPDFVKCLERGDRLITIDIASAYHHVEVTLRHRTLLGFNLDGVDYVYAVLPFGLSVAAYTFCKFSAVAADMIRRSGLCRALLAYMDDFCASLGAEVDEDKARAIVGIIESLGFIVNWPKTDLAMSTRVTSLGFIIDTALMCYDIPLKRIEKLEAQATSVLQLAVAGRGVVAREVCRLTGQVWSMQPALGLICRIRSRYLTLSMLPAAHRQQYGMVIKVSERAIIELTTWAHRVRHLPRMPLHQHLRRPDIVLECDASARAVAGIVVSVSAGMDFNGIQIHRELDERERRYSSCLRELLGYAHSVRTLAAEHPAHLRGRVLEIVGDSKASSYVFAKGGSQCADAESGELLIFEALLDILAAAEAGSFEVIFRWVPREMIVDADALSKVKDTMDFSLAPAVFDLVVKTYGPVHVDRFAAAHNAKCADFNSRFATVGSMGVDAYRQDWRIGTSYVLGHFHQLDRVLDVIERDNANAVIIVPEWTERTWWRRIWSGAFQRRVAAAEFIAGSALVPNSENAHTCFFTGPFNSRLLVMRTVAIDEAGVGRRGEHKGSAGTKEQAEEAATLAPPATSVVADSPQQRNEMKGKEMK